MTADENYPKRFDKADKRCGFDSGLRAPHDLGENPDDSWCHGCGHYVCEACDDTGVNAFGHTALSLLARTHNLNDHTPKQPMRPLKPIRDLVLIKPADPLSKAGALFIPSNAQQEQQKGTVIEVGPAATDVKPNDKVVFTKFAGTAIELSGVPHLLISEEHILGVIEE